MSKITTAISPQGFEVVRDRLGLIIADELSNQATLLALPDVDATVYVERFIPFDKTELPALNVNLALGNFGNKKAPDGVATYNYNVDIYCAAKTNDIDFGDKRAAFSMQRIAGIVRYILSDAQYRTLDFPMPFITRVTVADLNIKDPITGGQDGINVIMGRLMVEVLVAESQELLDTIALQSAQTSIKISESDNGFFYEL